MEKKIKIVQDGIIQEFDIIFSFCSKNDGKNYIVYTNYEEEGNFIKCYSALYENGQLLPVSGLEELKNIEEVLKTLNNRYVICS